MMIVAGVAATPDWGVCGEGSAAHHTDKSGTTATTAGASESTASATTAGAIKKTNLRENSYYYGAFNRRDPFRALVSGNFIRNDMMERVELTAVELVGVVRGDLDRFALLEDEKGFTYILRIGDKVRNGTVVAIGEQTMTARITNFGQTSKYTLHLVERQKGDKR
jgi:hypothetical protein